MVENGALFVWDERDSDVKLCENDEGVEFIYSVESNTSLGWDFWQTFCFKDISPKICFQFSTENRKHFVV